MPIALPNGDTTKLPRLPFVLEGQELDMNAALAKIREHTEEILLSLGYDQKHIRSLINNKPVAP
jgi:crotonobetainyl-CoA:carnitine CoA-transferase CaiB-like acyl-CoA transferase